jgi:hypothetical protein
MSETGYVASYGKHMNWWSLFGTLLNRRVLNFALATTRLLFSYASITSGSRVLGSLG